MLINPKLCWIKDSFIPQDRNEYKLRPLLLKVIEAKQRLNKSNCKCHKNQWKQSENIWILPKVIHGSDLNLPKTFDDFQEILVQAIQLSMAGSRAILVYYLPGMDWWWLLDREGYFYAGKKEGTGQSLVPKKFWRYYFKGRPKSSNLFCPFSKMNSNINKHDEDFASICSFFATITLSSDRIYIGIAVDGNF